MKRRNFLAAGVGTGLALFPARWVPAAGPKKQKVLYFTRCQGFIHSAVKREGDALSFSEKLLMELGPQAGFEVECSKDGQIFDGDLSQYDCFAFYTSGDLTKPSKEGTPAMSPEGKQRLLEAVAGGKGFVGFHSANDSFHSPGPRDENQQPPDPYIAMLGGEFVTHGPQQESVVRVTSPGFPGLKGVPAEWRLKEEWYALKNFAPDLHVILVQETAGMKGDCYQRPPFPATWARQHQQGRVFYTSFGHRHEIWQEPQVQQVILGGFAWALRNVDAEVTPNLAQVTPQAHVLPKQPPKPAAKPKAQ